MTEPAFTTEELCGLVDRLTGCNPLIEPAFELAGDRACNRCQQALPSVMVSLDGELFQRLCGTCLAHA